MGYSLPTLGVGVGFRREIGPALRANRDAVQWLEIISDQFLSPTVDTIALLDSLRSEFPIVPHGVEMSIATADDFDLTYVGKVIELVRQVRAPWFSDHLCFTRAAGVALGHLTPVPRTAESVELVVGRLRQIQSMCAVPFLLENITYYFDIPDSEMDEVEFINRICASSDCGLLLDLTNLHCNAVNLGYDPYKFIERLQVDRVVQVHLAGGEWHEGLLIDSHSQEVPEEVWDLLRFLVRRADVKGILIERDSNLVPFESLLKDVTNARSILIGACRGSRF